MKITVLVLVLFLSGCEKLNEMQAKALSAVTPAPEPVPVAAVEPCMTGHIEKVNDKFIAVNDTKGFQHVELTKYVERSEKRPKTHCIPCQDAKTADETFVCTGTK